MKLSDIILLLAPAAALANPLNHVHAKRDARPVVVTVYETQLVKVSVGSSQILEMGLTSLSYFSSMSNVLSSTTPTTLVTSVVATGSSIKASDNSSTTVSTETGVAAYAVKGKGITYSPYADDGSSKEIDYGT
ncbi:hypothetical protein BABINDRAFT_173123 [Babjeviella inositovora NRRL Y-12698]|uniref:Uncharacterized protein n=1 Tax=Babjeviella inositovora NRRL Y-12698 TaxID=984486 RepID=A0A1E3QWZ8_9ASCO|nr:uncharacterized protein BABINDRAFT_173123 [Babjeviella inositovora NRRL Y-12698]ODQ82186.1 hypothetical protein BABINDRAFT_173123 [Babjeviella inositovora NRRL Y-12698]